MTPFIASQSIELLLDTHNPLRHMMSLATRRDGPAAAGMGVNPEVGGAPSGADDELWEAISRKEFLTGTVRRDGRPAVSLRRTVLTIGAGIGKSVNLRWLVARLNGKGSHHVAFFVPLDRIEQYHDNDDAFFRHVLLPEYRRAGQPNQATDDQVVMYLDRLRRQGSLVLVCDALDQAGPAGIRTLERLVGDAHWDGTRVLVGGRPNVLLRNAALFTDAARGWRFVRLGEFDPRQQRLYLGKLPDGSDRYERVPEDARPILSVPRVLEYLREIPDADWSGIRTPGDVYWRATGHMIKKGLLDVNARMLGVPPGDPLPSDVGDNQIQLARRLLAAMAFEMTAERVRAASDSPIVDCDSDPEAAPNFGVVPHGRFHLFLQRVFDRVKRPHYGDEYSRFERDLNCLAAMNEVIEQGLLDVDSHGEGLKQLIWRNRQLQEFFAAIWMARDSAGYFQRAEKEQPRVQLYVPADERTLAHWIYLPDQPASEDYYWVWRFAVEMPDAEPEAWTRSIGTLYRPGQHGPDGTWCAPRSCEMIYRSWPRMTAWSGARAGVAHQVMDEFLGEFEAIRRGRQGLRRMWTAGQFIRSFQAVDGGPFQMGSPPEKQGMPPEARSFWSHWLDQAQADPEAAVDALLDRFSWPPGREGARQRASNREWYLNVARSRDLEAIRRRLYAGDETPAEASCQMAAFSLNRYPTLNSWFRLFDPVHGLRASPIQSTYQRVSGRPGQPTIFVSFFAAWVFCQWARWDGRSCRLPLEDEWEYCCKAGTPWDWNYWWGDDFDARRCTANQNIETGCTTAPRSWRSWRFHRNRWGFVDISGNILEWCADDYQQRYRRVEPEHSANTVRVLRGGSWNNEPRNVRSANRNRNHPTNSNNNVGFRVANALPSQTLFCARIHGFTDPWSEGSGFGRRRPRRAQTSVQSRCLAGQMMRGRRC